ncbi:TetR/AcrR family transcriptional regulator [bacterium]|nr:TetR/AcrR family transcriptional regulator [bacterium]
MATDAKQLILDAALQCFDKKGIDASTIADIREISGVSVGSIYHHFGNKEAIAVALYTEGVSHYARQLEAALVKGLSAEMAVKTVVYSYIDWVTEHRAWAAYLFQARGFVEASVSPEAFQSRQKKHFGRLMQWFMPYRQAGALRELPFETYHSLLMGPAQDFARQWLGGRTTAALSDYRELYASAAWLALKAA